MPAFIIGGVAVDWEDGNMRFAEPQDDFERAVNQVEPIDLRNRLIITLQERDHNRVWWRRLYRRLTNADRPRRP